MNFAATEELARLGRLYPAVILHGRSAEDRQEAALRLARTLLCEAERSARPCDSCKHCSRVVWPSAKSDAFHADFRVLERDLKTSTSVAATKEFLQDAQVAPFEARGQVFVLASAESLTGEAANALLKTLEEPHTSAPRHFLLLSPSQFDLLATVRSRSLPVSRSPGGSATRVSPESTPRGPALGATPDPAGAERISGRSQIVSSSMSKSGGESRSCWAYRAATSLRMTTWPSMRA